jgi:hypothetical protein
MWIGFIWRSIGLWKALEKTAMDIWIPQEYERGNFLTN